jgi:hypothetical protein
MEALQTQEPFLIVDYVIRMPQLIRAPDFVWTRDYLRDASRMDQMAQAFQAKTSRTPKFKFGMEVPYSITHALQLDKRAGNNLWGDAIGTELKQLNDYRTFRHRRPNEDLSEYTRIPYHCVFDVKFDGRRKCRLVAGGNMTSPSKESVFSGVVDISSVRLGFLLAALNDLQICAADIAMRFSTDEHEKRYIFALERNSVNKLSDRYLSSTKVYTVYGRRRLVFMSTFPPNYAVWGIIRPKLIRIYG